jgi:hypothetical protein
MVGAARSDSVDSSLSGDVREGKRVWEALDSQEEEIQDASERKGKGKGKGKAEPTVHANTVNYNGESMPSPELQKFHELAAKEVSGDHPFRDLLFDEIDHRTIVDVRHCCYIDGSWITIILGLQYHMEYSRCR